MHGAKINETGIVSSKSGMNLQRESIGAWMPDQAYHD